MMASVGRTLSSPFQKARAVQKFMSLQASNASRSLQIEIQDILRERTLARKRKKVINEIFETEKAYQYHLNLLIQMFLDPIRLGCILPNKVIERIFCNVEAIQSVNNELLEYMNKEGVAIAFQKLAPFIKLYSLYANNFEHSNKCLEEWEKKSSDFVRFVELQESREEMMGLKLRALLITPIQRVPRYKLLLDTLLEKTDQDHSDYKLLKDACEEISKVATHINECVRQHENFHKMLSIQNGLTGEGAPRILAPGRKFIKEGTLSKVCERGGSKDRMFFLFNDVLIYAKKETPCTFSCRGVFPLINCLVEQVMGSSQNNDGGGLFKIICKEKTLLLYSTSQQDANTWIRHIKSAISELHANLASLRRGQQDVLSPEEAIDRGATLRRSKAVKDLWKRMNPLTPLKEVNCASMSRDSLYPMRKDVLPRLARDAANNTEEEKSPRCLNSAREPRNLRARKRRLEHDESATSENMFDTAEGQQSLRPRRQRLRDLELNKSKVAYSPLTGDTTDMKPNLRSGEQRLNEEPTEHLRSPGCFDSPRKHRKTRCKTSMQESEERTEINRLAEIGVDNMNYGDDTFTEEKIRLSLNFEDFQLSTYDENQNVNLVPEHHGNASHCGTTTGVIAISSDNLNTEKMQDLNESDYIAGGKRQRMASMIDTPSGVFASLTKKTRKLGCTGRRAAKRHQRKKQQKRWEIRHNNCQESTTEFKAFRESEFPEESKTLLKEAYKYAKQTPSRIRTTSLVLHKDQSELSQSATCVVM